MFNARADTLYQKRTFRELALTPGRTCIWAVDGFYEWKESDADAVHRSGGKQPYYVHRSDGLPLLVAGLWTSVNTGREPDSTMHTFTAITTDACPKLQWLHTRMPLILWDTKDCLSWLRNPSPQLEKEIAHNCSTSSPSMLTYHPVSKKMNKTTYRASDCSAPIKIEKLPTLQSFFPASKKVAKQASAKKTTSSVFASSMAEHEETNESSVACPASPTASPVASAKKRTAQTQATPPQSMKKTKVLSIKKDFFSPKTSKQSTIKK
jgi:putative SOS response-associated peptidase YedK